MKHKIGIIGCGFVGSAISTGFETLLGDKIEIREYDKYKNTESLEGVVNNSNILFIALPTPMDFETGKCDTSIIENEIKHIVDIAEEQKIIVIKSTVPPGTTQRLNLKYNRKHIFVFNPEFLREKVAYRDFLRPDRHIVGVTKKSARFAPDVVKLLPSATHNFIMREVWGPNAATQTHYLRVYMKHLREKLEKNPAEPELLITEPGVGYRLTE